jgi:hypothetical protein
MSSRGKKKTTMAKLNREARLRDRRALKQERKDARRDARTDPSAEPLEFGSLESEFERELEPTPAGELEPTPVEDSR